MKRQKSTLWAASVALLGFGLAGCGVEVTAPGASAEQCLGENPPPTCENKEQPTENVASLDGNDLVRSDLLRPEGH